MSLKTYWQKNDIAITDTDTDMNGLEQWDAVPLPGPIEVGMSPNRKGKRLRLSFPSSKTPASSICFPCQRSEEEADTQPGRERGLQTSLPRRGRGLLAVFTGRERGLRLACPPWVGWSLDVPQLGRRRGLRSPSSPCPGSPPCNGRQS